MQLVDWVPTLLATELFFGYVALILLFHYTLPGKVVTGTKLSDGTELPYKCNGALTTFVLAAALVAEHFYRPFGFSATILYDNFFPLCTVVNIFAVSLTIYLYIKGIRAKAKRHGFFEDFVMGLELNPKIFGLDIKVVSLKIVMSLWLMISLSFLSKWLQTHPASSSFSWLEFLTTPMFLYQLFVTFYIADYFYFEPLITGRGSITIVHAVANILVFVTGYVIFRGANKQKNAFKRDPKALFMGKPQRAIDGKLLCSGFWGFSRHMNYLGILCVSSFELMFDVLHLNGYFLTSWLYPIYLTILLIHRERRDERRCAEKYKEIWKLYCREVPYRIFPGIY